MSQPGGEVYPAPFRQGSLMCSFSFSFKPPIKRDAQGKLEEELCHAKNEIEEMKQVSRTKSTPSNSDSHVSPKIPVGSPPKFQPCAFPPKICAGEPKFKISSKAKRQWEAEVDESLSESQRVGCSSYRREGSILTLRAVESSFYSRLRERRNNLIPSQNFPKDLMEGFGRNTFDEPFQKHLEENVFDGTIWNSGETWSWTDGGPGRDCTNETGKGG